MANIFVEHFTPATPLFGGVFSDLLQESQKIPLQGGARGLICSTKILTIIFYTKLLNTPYTSDVRET
jgi:hypothetical protein